jgi:predicted lipid-binding transport protein (Tim44 family)
MKKWSQKWILGLFVVVLGTVLAVPEAEARRFGGGRSTGVQRNITKAPPASAPAQKQQAAPNQQAPQNAAPASGLSRWAPMLGGLALGGLLGYLFAGNGLGGVLLLVLLAVAAVLAFRAFSRRREAPQPQRMQYAGLGQETVVVPPQSANTSMNTSMQAASSLPAGFNADAFLRGAKMNFVKLQMANDLGQVDEIREFTTDEMFEELKKDIAERGAAGQQTDVAGLDAELLEVATEGGRHWASVRFSGTVREAPGSAPEAFQEVWNLVKPKDGSSGWLLAGIQQMH